MANQQKPHYPKYIANYVLGQKLGAGFSGMPHAWNFGSAHVDMSRLR